VSKGYGRDHRDDLNQMVLELITESRANLPMMMRLLSGNASDRTSFFFGQGGLQSGAGDGLVGGGQQAREVLGDEIGPAEAAECRKRHRGRLYGDPDRVKPRSRLPEVVHLFFEGRGGRFGVGSPVSPCRSRRAGSTSSAA
jgi:hypothetical protein